MQTRLFRIIRQLFFNCKYQFILFQNRFTASLFFLFIGFVTGSSFCNIISLFSPLIEIDDENLFPGNGFIMIFMLVFFERVGKYVYNRPDSYKTQATKATKATKTWIFKIFHGSRVSLLTFLNCWKTGILFGFFVDAFKVGS